MKKKIIISFLLLIIVVIGIFLYTYKEHRNIATEKESFTITVSTLFLEFQTNEKKASTKYLDKTIEVDGTVSSIDYMAKSIIINEKLFILLTDKIPQTITANSKIKIKGRFIGYDELLEELKMDQCVIVN